MKGREEERMKKRKEERKRETEERKTLFSCIPAAMKWFVDLELQTGMGAEGT